MCLYVHKISLEDTQEIGNDASVWGFWSLELSIRSKPHFLLQDCYGPPPDFLLASPCPGIFNSKRMENKRRKDVWPSASWPNIIFWGLLRALPLVLLSGSGSLLFTFISVSISSFQLSICSDHPLLVLGIPSLFYSSPDHVVGKGMLRIRAHPRQRLCLDQSWIFLHLQPIVSLECKIRRKFLVSNYLETYDSSAFLYKNRHSLIIEVMAALMYKHVFCSSVK